MSMPVLSVVAIVSVIGTEKYQVRETTTGGIVVNLNLTNLKKGGEQWRALGDCVDLLSKAGYDVTTDNIQLSRRVQKSDGTVVFLSQPAVYVNPKPKPTTSTQTGYSDEKIMRIIHKLDAFSAEQADEVVNGHDDPRLTKVWRALRNLPVAARASQLEEFLGESSTENTSTTQTTVEVEEEEVVPPI